MATLASTHSLRPSNSSQSVRNVSASTSSSRSGHSTLTVDAALAQADGDLNVALDTVVNERNMLSGQNAQLWKLIEKQRGVMKELDRVRGERDRALAKLDASGGTMSSSTSTNTRIRASPSAPLTATTPTDDSDTTSPLRSRPARHYSSDVRTPSPDAAKASSSRPAPLRHQSEPQQEQRTPPIDIPQLSLTSPSFTPHTVVLEPSPTIVAASSPPPATVTSPPLSVSRSRQNRVSRISLPDEASRYIASMVDSPIPSPRGASSFNVSNSQPPPTVPEEAMGNTGSRSRSPDAREGQLQSQQQPQTDASPVEEMYAESIISVSSRRSRSRDVDESPFEDTVEVLEAPSPIAVAQTDDGAVTSDTVPSRQFSADSSAKSSPSQSGQEPDYQSALTTPSASSTALARDPSPTDSSSRSFQLPGHAPGSHLSFPPPGGAPVPKPAQFRSTRLTVNDLPYTRVRIHGSNIKTNDRGKEVLSFLFTVYPAGDGEAPTNPLKRGAVAGPGGPGDSWVVEKLYSEILALDASVRGKLGKNNGKKLAPLPDGKLFKDHAPAKADARKAILETYMQSLVSLPLKNKNEICMFLSTDLVRGTAVMNADHKEGYLTKRGKNFGGWKTRYFVLQSPILEYYESRGGQHLGSISINGAQIGRQQKNSSSRESDDENSYRHAFLIIENKKGPGGSSVRHVLCAETDEERDAWVELLVKYVVAGQGAAAKHSLAYEDGHRDSTSTAGSEGFPLASGHNSTGRISIDPLRWGAGASRRGDDAPKPSLDSFSESASINSSLTGGSSVGTPAPTDALMARRLLERNVGGQSPDVPLSSSLPSDQSMVGPGGSFNPPPPRSNSEQGHYSDTLIGHSAHSSSGGSGVDASVQSAVRVSPNGAVSSSSSSTAPFLPQATPRPSRASFHASHAAVKGSIASTGSIPVPDRAASPDKDGTPKVKISGPINGAPIPAGAKFGNEPSLNDRERKAKSGRFWGFGRAMPGSGPVGLVPRAVFGVPLDVSLAVAQVAELPAVVFRCIEYLEAKHAELEEGIYRLSGSSNVIKSLKERFNLEGDADLLKSDEFWDPHAIAGLLKTFLRDLPNSILTRELHLRFLGVIDLADQEERIQELATLVSLLPLPNYGLLRALTAHLILIVQNSHINKMTMRNVGIVFSPTLGIPAGVFGLMLGEFERVFNVDAAGEETLPVGEVPSPVDDGNISNRNSRSYADGSADKLLGLSGRKLKATDEESDDSGDDEIAESSGTETENDTQDTSPPNTPGPNTYTRGDTNSNSNSGGSDNGRTGTSSRTRVTHSAGVAAQRGLQVSIAATASGSGTSGLPASPRPRAMMAPNIVTPVGSPLTATTVHPSGTRI